MDGPERLKKLLALVTVVCLVAAFVLYRARSGANSMSGSKSTFMFVGSQITPSRPPARGRQAPAAPVESQAGRLNPFAPGAPGE
jgi:hypothetical protein